MWIRLDNTVDWTHPTEWRRLIGSPKLQIIIHKRAIKCRSLLRKMTYKDKGSYESSPPCIHVSTDGEDRNSHNYDCQNIYQVFTGVPIYIKHAITGVPKIANDFSVEYTMSPSLRKSIGKTDRSRDPNLLSVISSLSGYTWEVGGWGRDPFSRNFMKPTPRRKWYLTTGRRFH